MRVDAGHDVTGVHLALSRTPATLRSGSRGCCSREDAGDAQRAADVLGIPFYVWDVSERFQADVVDDFVAEYAAGRTPNPCVRCNERIKFSAVLDRALALGFDAVVTGHYARRVDGADGPELHRAADVAKDQSYVLAVLRPDQLAHALFPLGDTCKADVRAEAAGRGLGVAAKPDSHDICFVADGDTRGFLRRSLGRPARPAGRPDGRDRRPARRRVRVHGRAAPWAPARCPGSRRAAAVRARHRARLGHGHRRAARVAGHLRRPGHGSASGAPELRRRRSTRTVQLRAHGEQVPASVDVAGQQITARLSAPAYGVADGQTVVVYAGTRVVGSATISSPAAPSSDGGEVGPAVTPATRQSRGRGRQVSPDARATGVGSLPGDDVHEAVRLVVGELPDLPHLPELPDRGVPGGLVGRAVGVLSGLGADLQPAGWRLTDAPGADQRRARSLLAEDLDALEEHTQGFTGTVKLQVDRTLDAGRVGRASARRPRPGRPRCPPRPGPVAGRGRHGARGRRVAPGTRAPSWSLQLDEPSLPAVLGGRVPTASGFGPAPHGPRGRGRRGPAAGCWPRLPAPAHDRSCTAVPPTCRLA